MRLRHMPRPVVRVAIGAVAVLLLATGCGVAASHDPAGGQGGATARTATATDSSGVSPDSTITDYLARLNAHDVPGAEGLVSAQHARTLSSEPSGWFTNPVTISDISLGTPEVRDGHGTLAEGYSQVVFVPAQLTVASDKAGTTPNGHVSWGFLLARNSMVSRWVIVDEGPA